MSVNRDPHTNFVNQVEKPGSLAQFLVHLRSDEGMYVLFAPGGMSELSLDFVQPDTLEDTSATPFERVQ